MLSTIIRSVYCLDFSPIEHSHLQVCCGADVALVCIVVVVDVDVVVVVG